MAPFLTVDPILEPFRELLKKPTVKFVYWDEQFQALFLSAKDTIEEPVAEVLCYYDVSRSTAAFTDYNHQEIVFMLCSSTVCVYLRSPCLAAQTDGKWY